MVPGVKPKPFSYLYQLSDRKLGDPGPRVGWKVEYKTPYREG